jgi:hypothetical protein
MGYILARAHLADYLVVRNMLCFARVYGHNLSQHADRTSLSGYFSLVTLFRGGSIQLSNSLPTIFPTCPGIPILILLYARSDYLSFLSI